MSRKTKSPPPKNTYRCRGTYINNHRVHINTNQKLYYIINGSLQEAAPLTIAEKDTIYKLNRISSGVIWLLLSFSRAVLFGFSLDPWNIYSQVLEHLRNIGYKLYLIQWVLNLILYWLVTSTSFVLPWHFCFLHPGHFL